MALIVEFVTSRELRDYAAGRLDRAQGREMSELLRHDSEIRSALLDILAETYAGEPGDAPPGTPRRGVQRDRFAPLYRTPGWFGHA